MHVLYSHSKTTFFINMEEVVVKRNSKSLYLYLQIHLLNFYLYIRLECVQPILYFLLFILQNSLFKIVFRKEIIIIIIITTIYAFRKAM